MNVSWTDLIQLLTFLIAFTTLVYKVCKDIFKKK